MKESLTPKTLPLINQTIIEISLLLLRLHLRGWYFSTLPARPLTDEFDKEGTLPSLGGLDWNNKIAEISNIRAMGRVEGLDTPKEQLGLICQS